MYSFLATGDLPAEVQIHIENFAERLDAEIAERFPDGQTFETSWYSDRTFSIPTILEKVLCGRFKKLPGILSSRVELRVFFGRGDADIYLGFTL